MLFFVYWFECNDRRSTQEYSADRATSFRRCYIKLCEHFEQVEKSTADFETTFYRNVLTKAFKCSDHLYSSSLK